MIRPTRRLLLGAPAALAVHIVPASAGAVPSPDADLIAACARYVAEEGSADLEVIIYTKATTAEGREAKALAAMTLVQTWRDGTPMGPESGMLWSLAEDLAGRELEAPL